MDFKHSRDEARSAKATAVARFRDDAEVTGVGLGMTEDRSDYAVVVNVASPSALRRLPSRIGSVPVRATVTGVNRLF